MTSEPADLRLVASRFDSDIVTAFSLGEQLGWRVGIEGDRIVIEIREPGEIARVLQQLDDHPGVRSVEVIHNEEPR